MIAQIDKRIARALGHIRLAFRGLGARVNSDAPVQLIQGEGLAGERINDNEYFQHYGLTSNPPPGFMYVCLPIGGKTAHGIAIATEHATYRLKSLKPGEVALYTDEGDSIVLKRGRLIEVNTQTYRVNAGAAIEFNAPTITHNASSEVAMNTPLVAASTDIKAQGEVIDHGNKTMSGMRQIYDSHTHNENNTTGPTNQPNQLM